MSWGIERAKSWVEQQAHPTFQFTCLFEHFEALWLRMRHTLLSYSNRIPTYFSFFSSSLNYSWKVRNWEPSITTLNGGAYRRFLFLTGTWNSGSLSSLVTHPSLMPCSMCISSVFGTWPWDLLRPRFSNQNWRNGSENRRQTNIRGVCCWVST